MRFISGITKLILASGIEGLASSPFSDLEAEVPAVREAAQVRRDARRAAEGAAAGGGAPRTRRVVASFWQISAKCCSFSAVSESIFVRK